jgi:protein transport protein SEC31
LVSLQQTKGYLSTIISAVVTEDWSQVVGACEVDSWKEALAAVLTYTKNVEFPSLCGKNRVDIVFR